MRLPTRPFGKTGVEVSVIALGTGAFGFNKVTHEEGVAIVSRAFELGITFFDTAHFYETELMVGEALQGRRQDVFLATKSIKRNRDAALADLELSLKQLRTDYLDLWQIHSINTLADADAVLGPGGALEAAVEAQRTGLVRFIGMTGHGRPNVLAYALERFPLDAVMPALGIVDSMVSGPEHFLLPAAQKAGCGIIAMKVLAAGALAAEHSAAIRYALDLGAHTVSVGVQSIAEVEQAAAVGADPRPLSEAERAALTALARTKVVRENKHFWLQDHEVLAYLPGWVGAKP